jgi:hypothetical protein
MATDKQFTVVGVSKLAGEYKVRFANDIMRIKVLAKHGHEDIRLAELDTAMTKVDAVKALASMDEFQDVVAQAAIADYLDRNDAAPKAPKAKATKAPAKAKAKAAPKAKAKSKTEDEDTPFAAAEAAVGEALV